MRSLLEREPGLLMAGTSTQPDISQEFSLGGCALQARAFGVDSSTASDQYVSIWPPLSTPGGSTVACKPALRRLAALIDAELATGRHDALLKLD